MVRPVSSTQIARARSLRRKMTDAERRLWHELKAHRLEGLHFRPQVPLGPFIADFVCHAHKLIIEVDGGQHNERADLARDEARTRWLNAIGYRVLRLWNVDVLANMEGVIDATLSAIAEATPSLPSPWDGGGKKANPSEAACILAGGRGLRMGGRDKAFIELAGKPLIDHVIRRLAPQAGTIFVNGEPSRFHDLNVPVIADSVPGFAGPLAGVLAGMERARQENFETVLTVAVDVPFLPDDLVERLREARGGNDVACASSGGRMHHVIALWPVSMAPRLRHALVVENLRKVEAWLARHRVGIAEWPVSPYDFFFNINAPQDLEKAEEIAREFFS